MSAITRDMTGRHLLMNAGVILILVMLACVERASDALGVESHAALEEAKPQPDVPFADFDAVLVDSHEDKRPGAAVLNEELPPGAVARRAVKNNWPLGFSPNGREVLIAQKTEKTGWQVVKWSPEKRSEEIVLKSEHAPRFMSPCGRYVVVGNWDAAFLLEASSGREICRVALSQDCRFSPDGKTLACLLRGRQSDSVVVWDTTSGKELHRVPVDKHYSQIMPLISRGIFLVLWTYGNEQDENSCSVWRVDSGQKTREFPTPRSKDISSYDISFSECGKMIFVVERFDYFECFDYFGYFWKTKLTIWEVATGRERERERLVWSGKRRISVSSHNQYLVLADKKRLSVCRLHSKKEAVLFEGGRLALGVFFSPDHQRLLSWHDDGTIVLWDVVKVLGKS